MSVEFTAYQTVAVDTQEGTISTNLESSSKTKSFIVELQLSQFKYGLYFGYYFVEYSVKKRMDFEQLQQKDLFDHLDTNFETIIKAVIGKLTV